MRPAAPILCALFASPACLGATITENFESYAPGAFPASPWRDIATAAIPNPVMPTGEVIDTTGPDGSPTRAFQVFQRTTASQGIIADIAPTTTQRLEADLRVDIHPTPVRYGDWTAAMGFFQQEGPPVDINAEPQGVVYVYNQRWFFYGYTSGANFINTQLGTAPVSAGEWYHVTLDSDTTTGAFTVSVLDAMGSELVNQSLLLPGYTPALGQYNRIAVFDGEYSGRAATPGQFSADNIAYVPAPGSIALLSVGALGATRRARRNDARTRA